MVGMLLKAEKNLVESPCRILPNGFKGDMESAANENDTGFPQLTEIGILVF